MVFIIFIQKFLIYFFSFYYMNYILLHLQYLKYFQYVNLCSVSYVAWFTTFQLIAHDSVLFLSQYFPYLLEWFLNILKSIKQRKMPKTAIAIEQQLHVVLGIFICFNIFPLLSTNIPRGRLNIRYEYEETQTKM